MCRLSSSAVLAVLGIGCGLSHYQDQMREQQIALNRLEEENQNLDEPVKLPDKKDRPAYFFRPPLGIAIDNGPHDSSVLRRFVPKPNTPSYFEEVGFGVENMKPEEFWSSLLRVFPNKEPKDAKDVVKNFAGRSKRFKELKSDNGMSIAYVWSEGNLHAAALYRLTRADEHAMKLIDTSLGTLTVGADATRRKQAYQKAKSQSKPAAPKRREGDS
jgi:hypothetical protein